MSHEAEMASLFPTLGSHEGDPMSILGLCFALVTFRQVPLSGPVSESTVNPFR